MRHPSDFWKRAIRLTAGDESTASGPSFSRAVLGIVQPVENDIDDGRQDPRQRTAAVGSALTIAFERDSADGH